MREEYEKIKNVRGSLDANSNEDGNDLPAILAELDKRLDYRIEVGKQYAGFWRQSNQVL